MVYNDEQTAYNHIGENFTIMQMITVLLTSFLFWIGLPLVKVSFPLMKVSVSLFKGQCYFCQGQSDIFT